jgi:hypothetical protein
MDNDFLKRKQIGDKGEAFTMGYLYGKHTDCTVQHVEEYYTPGKYRWNNLRLPDFMLTDANGNKTLIEVKSKKGFKNKLNVSCAQVRDYLRVAELKGYGFLMMFFCSEDGYIYLLTTDDLRNPSETVYPRDKPDDPFFLYDKTPLTTLSQKIPHSVFNSDILRN